MAAAAEDEWERCHPPNAPTGAPSHLYTDENPATTIKGMGFKDRRAAERSISLSSQSGVRYKQLWTVRAMRERALHHPHQTCGMRDAIHVFDDWLGRYTAPSVEERKEQEEEWKAYRELCESAANKHAYGKVPSREQLKRARDDTKEGRKVVMTAIQLCQRTATTDSDTFLPITAFTAVFGGPGLHGYGKHAIDGSKSHVIIEGTEGLEELLGKKASALGIDAKRVYLRYDRNGEAVRADIEQSTTTASLDHLWNRSASVNMCKCNGSRNGEEGNAEKEPSWTCNACTLMHMGQAKQIFLACELCGAARESQATTSVCRLTNTTVTSKAPSPSSTSSASPKQRKAENAAPTSPQSASVQSPMWGCLRAPSTKDIQGPRKRRKGLDSPPPMMDHIVVLDFEWTADNMRKMEPIAEITQFPSVVMKLVDGKKRKCTDYLPLSPQIKDMLPGDLIMSDATSAASTDAYAISLFDTFIRPTLNPTLTKFSIDLTAITQEQVNAAPTIDEALKRYERWLHSLGIVDADGTRVGNWCFATWGDVDIMTTLGLELQYKSIQLPSCFDRWINLKDDAMFKRHYRREPRGGLRSCVESVGAKWEGRAHNGLIDSINTAKIVRDMARTGFRFTRPTRGLDRDGVPFGQKKLDEKQ